MSELKSISIGDVNFDVKECSGSIPVSGKSAEKSLNIVLDGYHSHDVFNKVSVNNIDYFNIPKHETVEQWEERTGLKYSLDDLVWFYGYKRGEHGEEWSKAEYWKVKDSFLSVVYYPEHGKPNIEELEK